MSFGRISLPLSVPYHLDIALNFSLLKTTIRKLQEFMLLFRWIQWKLKEEHESLIGETLKVAETIYVQHKKPE
jgi:hypothetical protein